MEKLLEMDEERFYFNNLRAFKRLFEVELVQQSNTLDLTANASSPELARDRVENWITIYQQRLNQLRKEDSQARVDFTQKELNEAKRILNQTQAEVSQFQASSGLVSTEEQTKGMVQLIDRLSAAKHEAEVRAEANEKKVASLSGRLGLTPAQAIQAVSLSENQDYQAIRRQLTELELNLSRLTTTRTEADPQVQEVRRQKEQLQAQLRQYERGAGSEANLAQNAGRTALIQQLILAESEAQAQRKEAEQLENKINELESTLKAVPTHRTSLQKLEKEKDVAEGVYQGVIAKLQQAKIDAFNSYPHIQTLEPARADSRPVGPKKMLIQINAMLASLVGSVALIILLEKRNPLLNEQDLQEFSFPVLGCIRQFGYFGRSGKNSEFLFNLVSQPNAQIELDFQRLASAVSLQTLENRRLLVTSAIAGEGKTTVTIGLAKALADLGFKVLMVDADSHKAELTKSFAYVADYTSPDKPVAVSVNLYLQTTGLPQTNTAALVKQGIFEQGLELAESSDNYDYILVDTAPVSLTSETALMASAISNVLYVVRPNVSERNSVYSSFEQLHQHRAQIRGLVINGIESYSRPYKLPALEAAKN